jgi:DNA-binding beta-propeller fold protein YncE
VGEIVGTKFRTMRNFLAAGVAVAGLLLSGGCGGGGGAANVITIAVSSSSGFFIILGQSTTLTATVTGATNTMVKWTPEFLTSKAPCQYTTTTTDSTGKTTTSALKDCPTDGTFGTLTNIQDTGTAVYTAPSNLPKQSDFPGLQIIITAESAQDTKRTGKVTLTLTSGIRVVLTPVTATVPTKEKEQFFVTLTNDLQNKSVTWLLTQNVTSSTVPTVPKLPTCSPTCGTINPDTNNPNVAIYTAPDTVPTAITPAQMNNTTLPQNVAIVATSNSDSTAFVAGTITIVKGGPITFNGITPTIAPLGAAVWDIYLNAPNISSASSIVLNYQDGANPPNIVGTKKFDSTGGQIKILFPIPAPSTSTTTTTTPPASIGARLRLLEQDLVNFPGAVSVLVTVTDPAEPVCPPTCTAPATPPPASAFTFQFVSVRPTSVSTVPDDVVQGKQTLDTRVIIDGGYFGPIGNPGNPAVAFFQGNGIEQDPNHPSTSRQLDTLLLTSQINSGSPGLYPISVESRANPLPTPNNPSVTNIAVFPDYSSTPPAVTSTTVPGFLGIPAGANPSAIDLDTSLGVVVVAEAGAPATSTTSAVPSALQFYAIGKGTLTPIDGNGAACTPSASPAPTSTCPYISNPAANLSINLPTGLSVNRTLHTVAIVNYADQSVTVLQVPVPGASSQAAFTPFTVDISGALQNSVSPAPLPYSIGVDADSNLAVVAYSSTSASSAANLGFIVNLNPDSAASPNPYGCALDHAVNPASTKVGQCLFSQVTLNTGTYPHVATAPHGHLALVTPGGSGVVRGVDVTKPSSGNVILSSTLTAGLVTVTIDTSHCPPPLPDPTTTPPSNPCPFTLVPGNAGTVLITGVKPGTSANEAFFNGSFSVNVTSNNSFTYTVNSTASDSGTGGCQTNSTTNVKTCAEVLYSSPDQIFVLSPTLQGVAINPVTRTAAMADANAPSAGQIWLLNSLDQTTTTISFSAGCSAFTTSCPSAPEFLGTADVAWQPYTNALVSYNPHINQVSISDPVSRQRFAFACNNNGAPITPGTCLTNPVTAQDHQTFQNQIVLNGTGMASLTVQNGTTNSLNLFGGLAVDPVTNQAFVLKSGSGTMDVINLGGPATATPIKPTHVSEIIVPSPNPGPGVIGGIPNALVPQATLTSTQPLSGVQIFGSGFASGLQVRLDGVDITTQGGTIDKITAGGREVDVTIPPSFLSVPHKFALDVVSNNAASNAADFFVIQEVPLSKVCTDSSGNPTNTQPSSVAIADQIANGPFSPLALVSVTGCNSIVAIDLNPTVTVSGVTQPNPNFGKLIGGPVSVGTNPQGIAIGPHLGLAVVANHGSNTASVLDLTPLPLNPPVQKVPDVAVGTNPTGAAINDATGAAIITNTGSNSVSMINLGLLFPASGTTPPTTLQSTPVGGIQEPTAVAIDPDRGITHQGIAVVSTVRLAGGQAPSGALDVIEIGQANPALSTTFLSGFTLSTPTGIVFDPAVFTGTANPGVFYANSSGTNSITQFNPDNGSGPSVNVGVNPTSLAINPQTGAILTSNSASNTISIVDTLSNPFKTRQTLGIPGSPTFGVAIDQFTNLAVIVDQANMRVLLFPMPN